MINSYLTVNRMLWLLEGLFSKYFVNVNVILNFKKELYIPLKPMPKEDTVHR